MISARLLAGLAMVAALVGCQSGADADAAREALLAKRLTRFQRAVAEPINLQPNAPIARWVLPDELAELSGLTLTADDRLFTHGDEFGQVFELDYRRGTIVKSFSLGPPLVMDDFEAIAAVGDSMYMLTAQGIIYRFAEGADGAGVPYTTVDTKLGTLCEFEGMTFDSTANSLVLSCKNVEDSGANETMLLFLWPLDRDSTAVGPPQEIRMSVATIVSGKGWPKIEPSDIAVNPANGNYRIVASGQKGLFEVTKTGEVVFSRALPSGHAQPEGLAMSRDNLMLISDEATTGPAVLTVYRRQ